MNEAQRIDYLVKALEGNNAKDFASKCGIDPKAVSNMRHGRQGIGSYVERICTGYPEVSKNWLLTGRGKPFPSRDEKGEIMEKIEGLEREVRRLAKMVEKLASTHKSTHATK